MTVETLMKTLGWVALVVTLYAVHVGRSLTLAGMVAAGVSLGGLLLVALTIVLVCSAVVGLAVVIYDSLVGLVTGRLTHGDPPG